MLNNEVFRQYLLLKESMKMKEIEENEKRSKESIQHESMDPAVRKAIEEGRSYVKRIREANYAIQNVEISRKLDKLEEVTEKIFDYVETRPHKLPEIRKFVGYFLPTTLKLLDAYRELDSQSVQGKNISSAKAEIEQSLDTINTAFDNLLDGLFEEIAMDISTDISVLETMFAQEGLTRNKKSPKNENEG
jgi:5-bromo-4-chloroindolyl phosphate hydrolysis protein